MTSLERVDWVEQLRAAADPGSLGGSGLSFVRADLRGANLAGLHLAFVSLAGARLDDANLSGASLRHVDLTSASLAGADLTDVRFELVHATTASFAGARLTGAEIDHTILLGASLAGADLRRATIRASSLDGSCLTEADLTRASLTDSTCADATFRGTILDRVNTGGSVFARADLTTARRFSFCREIVVELIRRETGDDPEWAHLLGAALLLRWGYVESRQALAEHPGFLERALAILGQYPESGAMEALRDGWRCPRPEHA